ncbi:MAG: MCE family protein [Elusimicrobia bacterium]|nr:MCE family protein [Elusimicrobiota bacterium]
MKQETKVGAVIIVGTLILAISIMVLSGVRVLEKGYTIDILFNDIQGLLKQAKVQVAGVNVGYVKNITLENGKANVTVWLDKDVKIYSDTDAYIFSTGIIGVKFIQLTPGTKTEELLKDGDKIVGIDPISIDKMFEQTETAINSLLDSLLGLTVEGGIKSTINNLNKFTADLKAISKEIKDAVPKGRLQSISKKLDTTLSSLEKVSKSIEKGEGAFGKLVNDKKVEKDLESTIQSLRVFSKMMEEAPSKWIVDEKKARKVKKDLMKELERERAKEQKK